MKSIAIGAALAALIVTSASDAAVRHRSTHHGERQVWIWANYWSCKAVGPDYPLPASSPTVDVIRLNGGALICGWVPSHWQWIPRTEHCHLVPLTDSDYLITECRAALRGALARATPRHRACRWHLHVTGGQTPGSPVVLHLTNTCARGGPTITKRVGTINVPQR